MAQEQIADPRLAEFSDEVVAEDPRLAEFSDEPEDPRLAGFSDEPNRPNFGQPTAAPEPQPVLSQAPEDVIRRQGMMDETIKKKNSQSAVDIIRAPLLGLNRAVLEIHENMADFLPMPDAMEEMIREGVQGVREQLPTPEEQGVVAGVVSTLSQFGIPFGVGAKMFTKSATIGKRIMKAMAGGAAVDVAVFDEHEQRLSNWLTKIDNPILNNSVTQFMAAREDDPAMMGKIRQLVEGTALGLTAEGFVATLRAIKGFRMAKEPGKFGLKDVPDPLGEEALLGLESKLGTKFGLQGVRLDDLEVTEGFKTGARVEDISRVADDIQTGIRQPSILVEIGSDGKPTKILSGADDIKAMQMLGTRADLQISRIKVKTLGEGTVDGMRVNAELVDLANRRSREAKKRLHKNFGQRLLPWAKADKWVDASSDIKKGLLKEGGQTGKIAVMQHDLAAGATPKAHHIFQQYAREVYQGLRGQDELLLDDIINSRRIVEIDNYKEQFTHADGLTGRQHGDKLKVTEMELGPEKWADMTRRADRYFDGMREQLTDLHTNGLINDELFEKLRRFDYRPIRYLDIIDPLRAVDIGGKKISVRDSGIALLEHGKGTPVELSSRELLTQVVGRTQNRIARNKANIALRQVGIDMPANSIVRVPKPRFKTVNGEQVEVPTEKVKTPKGFSRVSVLVDGEPQPIFIDAKLAGQWISQDPQTTREWAEALRWASGSPIVRALATGHNPGFAVTNFPRDIMHIYMSTQEYSRHLPIALGQMGKDLSATMMDAVWKKGSYIDYVQEGGGMNFLTHQGRDVFVSSPDAIKQQLDPQFEKLKKVTGYVGETSELWTRLMLRNRALRNMEKRGDVPLGDRGRNATWTARNYMDFSQGGSWAKAADHQIPYFNAVIQALRGGIRSAKQDPWGFAIKTGWLQATSGGLYWANFMNHPEAMAQISDQEMQDYWVFPTGGRTVDKKGNIRHHYFRIKKDDVMKPLLWPVDAAMIRFFKKKPIDKGAFQTMTESLPLMKSRIPIPTISALATYLSNHDFWYDEEIWKGKTLPWPLSREEYKGPGQGINPTPKSWVLAGEAMGVSPERAETAFRSVVPQNPIMDLAVGGGQLGARILGGGPVLEDQELDKTLMEVLNSMPIVRRFSHLTHPAETEMDRADEVSDEARAERIRTRRWYADEYNEFKRGRQSLGDVQRKINQLPEADRKRTQKHHDNGVQLDIAFSRFKGVEGMPSSILWMSMMQEPPEVRAQIFYKEWVGKDSAAKRKQMLQLGQSLKGFWSKEFRQEFGKIINRQGREEH